MKTILAGATALALSTLATHVVAQGGIPCVSPSNPNHAIFSALVRDHTLVSGKSGKGYEWVLVVHPDKMIYLMLGKHNNGAWCMLDAGNIVFEVAKGEPV